MDMTEAFKQLDKILQESTATDNLKQLLTEIDQLDNGIKELWAQKDNSWKTEYSKKFEKESAELLQLKNELRDLIDTYRHKYYTDWDSDGDPTNFEYSIDEKKKSEVAEREADIRKRLAGVEARYDKLVAEVKAEHEASFADHTAAIADKSSVLKTKKERKKEIFNKIVEEEQLELEKLLNKIIAAKEVTADPRQITLHKGSLYVSLTKTFDCEVEENDLIFDDNNEPSFDSNRIEASASEDQGDEGLYMIAEYLGINKDIVYQALKSEQAINLEIPNSTWKLCTKFDIEVGEPHINVNGWFGDGWNEPREFDYDYDDTVECTATYYLIKEL